MEEFTEEELYKIADRNCALGIMKGMKRVANLLLDKSIVLWTNGQEEKGKWLKNISKELIDEIKELETKYDKEYKEVLRLEIKRRNNR